MATTAPPAQSTTDAPGRGLSARVRLGTVFTPVSTEFVVILSSALILTGFGFVMVLSATSASPDPFDTALKQGIFAAIGIPLMLVLSRAKPRFWRAIAWPVLIVCLAFQMLIYTPLAVHADGNTSWVNIGGIQAQPAEFLKLATAIWIGFILARKEKLLHRPMHFWIPLAPVVALVLASVLGGQDLGTAMVLGLVVLSALFFAGVRLRFLLIPIVIAVVGVAALAIASPNRMHRITSFLDPNCDIGAYLGACDQQVHGLWALANGGLFGVGLGNSIEKYGWLPAKGNDFIFAIVGEETGLIGCVVVLALFGLLLWGGMRIVRRSDDLFVRIVAGAVTVWIVGQAMVNIAVVLRLAPALGVPLPFLSQGGTSLVSVLIAVGVLLSFARTLPAGSKPRSIGEVRSASRDAVQRAARPDAGRVQTPRQAAGRTGTASTRAGR